MESGTSKPKVLVVEDNNLLSSSIYALLKENYDVTIANDGNSAMTLLYYNDYDAILCDIILPIKNGMDVHNFIKKIKPHLLKRLIFTSGGSVDNLSFVDPDYYIAKPFSGQQIKTFLNSIIYS